MDVLSCDQIWGGSGYIDATQEDFDGDQQHDVSQQIQS